MNAVKFLKEKKRMCCENSSCNQCIFYKSEVEPVDMSCTEFVEKYPEKVVAFVDEWSTAHQLKTRQSGILAMFPNASTDKDGVLWACPKDFNGEEVCPSRLDGAEVDCTTCRNTYWLESVE